MVNVKVEVIDTKLNYNLLLDRSWTHTMLCIPSTLFRVLWFPHEGNIISVDQLSFFNSTSFESNVSYVDCIPTPYESIRFGIYKDPTLMGLFSLPPPKTAQVNMISNSYDPWIIPSPDQVDSFGDVMS